MTNPIALDLLKLAEHYLSALHGSVARHDNIGLNLSCGGCALRDEIRDVLPKLAAAVSVPPPATRADDRRARYAAAIAEGFRAFDADTTSDAYLDAELLDAVVAVADAEEAELLAAVPVVPPAPRADNRATFVAEAEAKLTAGCPDHGPNGGWLMTCQCEAIGVLQDLAAEQQPVGPCVAGEQQAPLCRCGHGKADHDAKYSDPQCRLCPEDGERSWRHAYTPAGEQQNETPEGKPGCAHCGGDHSWDDCEAYTALVSEEQPPTDKEPEPGDRVRVTYEGTWLADDDPRTLLVGNHSGDIWRNIAPDHARVEVLPAVEAPE